MNEKMHQEQKQNSNYFSSFLTLWQRCRIASETKRNIVIIKKLSATSHSMYILIESVNILIPLHCKFTAINDKMFMKNYVTKNGEIKL